ncbi:hypothetical protein [Herbaspirillum robiniae]|uniref:Uncharacterized protein n=1 Tax=Herbaspirillum robiniae TaxID=2014887 RepID=A0A246WS30_9BURK|nr:hypothetical protein [Herbaspirillum robiniae]NUU01539.1 hypothetical protein [Herbaspirillum robiniae]OWY28463.1 hypothetical protein CEJ42_14615 [Herbaspirillum robiniae]
MTQVHGATYRGRRISVACTPKRDGDVVCAVSIDGAACPQLRGNPFSSLMAAQVAGISFGRAMIDAALDADTSEHRGFFIRVSSAEQRDGSWVGSYHLHRNDNPVPFRRVSCEELRGNTPVEVEQYAASCACAALDADIAAGRL